MWASVGWRGKGTLGQDLGCRVLIGACFGNEPQKPDLGTGSQGQVLGVVWGWCLHMEV